MKLLFVPVRIRSKETNKQNPLKLKAMKANSKEVRQAVRKYILDRVNFEGYDVPSTGAGLLQIFNSEYGSQHHRKQYPSTQVRFCEWLKGLPSSLQVEMDYNEVRRILIEDFKTNTPTKRDDEKSFNFFLYLIYVEVVRWSQEPQKDTERLLKKIEKTFK